MKTVDSINCSSRIRTRGLAGIRVYVLLLFAGLITVEGWAQASSSLSPYVITWHRGKAERTRIDVPPEYLPSVIIQRPDRSIAFYVVGGDVLDTNFDYLGGIPGTVSEVIVVPIPGSETQYLLVGEGESPVDLGRNALWFLRLDASTLPGQNRPIDTTGTIPAVSGIDNWCDNVTLAASHPAPTQAYLFVKSCHQVVRYPIDYNGVGEGERLEYSSPVDADDSYILYSELELHERQCDGKRSMRLAFPQFIRQGNSGMIRMVVINPDSTSEEIEPLMDVVIHSSDIAVGHVAVPGLEFSPNGRYLYVMTSAGLKCFDVENNGNPVATEAHASQRLLFNRSQIEVDPDGDICMAGPNSMAMVKAPNNIPAGWWEAPELLNPIAKFINGVYLLPNQIDPVFNCSIASVPVSGEKFPAITLKQLSPSPTYGMLEVAYTAARRYEQGLLRVRNVIGQCVLETPLAGRVEQGLNQARVDLGGLPAGTYFVSVEAGGMSAVKMIQVVR